MGKEAVDASFSFFASFVVPMRVGMRSSSSPGADRICRMHRIHRIYRIHRILE